MNIFTKVVFLSSLIFSGSVHAEYNHRVLTKAEAIRSIQQLENSLRVATPDASCKELRNLSNSLGPWLLRDKAVASTCVKHLFERFLEYNDKVKASLIYYLREIGKNHGEYTSRCVSLLEGCEAFAPRETIETLCLIKSGVCPYNTADIPYLLSIFDRGNVEYYDVAVEALVNWLEGPGKSDEAGMRLVIEKVTNLLATGLYVDRVNAAKIAIKTFGKHACQHNKLLQLVLQASFEGDAFLYQQVYTSLFKAMQASRMSGSIVQDVLQDLLPGYSGMSLKRALLVVKNTGLNETFLFAKRAASILASFCSHVDDEVRLIAIMSLGSIRNYNKQKSDDLDRYIVEIMMSAIDDSSSTIRYVASSILACFNISMQADVTYKLTEKLLAHGDRYVQLVGMYFIEKAFKNDQETGLRLLKAYLGDEFSMLNQHSFSEFLYALKSSRAMREESIGRTFTEDQKMEEIMFEFSGFKALKI